MYYTSSISLYLTEKGKAMCKAIAMWMCGMTKRKSQILSPYERAAIQKRFTSLEENETTKAVLNFSAIGLSMLTAFLFGYFS